jgi:hypothetical protein
MKREVYAVTIRPPWLLIRLTRNGWVEVGPFKTRGEAIDEMLRLRKEQRRVDAK